MDDLDTIFKSRYKEALKHAIHGRTERALTICWELRLEPRLAGTYRRCMLDTLFAQVLEPYGQMSIVEGALEDISALQERTRFELTPGLEILRPILQNLGTSWRMKQGYRAERTNVENSGSIHQTVAQFERAHHVLDPKDDRLTYYRKKTKKLFKVLAETSFKEDKAVGWEDQASVQRDDLVASEMKHLGSEELSTWSLSHDLDEEREYGHLHDDEDQELGIREAALEAWCAGIKKRRQEIGQQEIAAMEKKGFSKEDQLRSILGEMQFDRSESIFHDEFRMPLLRALPEIYFQED